MPRSRIFILALAIGYVLRPVSADAQAPQQKPVTFNLSIPIVVKSLHPDIVAVRASCTIYLDAAMFLIQSSDMMVASLAQNGGAGTITVSKVINVSADAGGKAGRYICGLDGTANKLNYDMLQPAAPDPRFKVLLGGGITVAGTFTW